MFKKMTIQFRKILPWIILGVMVAGLAVWLIYRFTAEKRLQLVSPNGNEKWRAGKTYQIAWKAKNIEKVAIALTKGEDSKTTEWIAEGVPAGNKKYDWEIFVWKAPGQDYKITIFEYPWQEGNKIDYSDENFTILGPQFASCDSLSIADEWPFLPSDYPDQRRVFITQSSFTGNLEGLEGADKKCRSEAEKEGLEGNWKAFLGDDEKLAMDRVKLDGIVVEARPAAALPGGKTCHRLLGKDFNEFFKKLSVPLAFNQEKLEENFLNDLSKIWLGRINAQSKRDCLTIPGYYLPTDISRSYSFTSTCQNWTSQQGIVSGYPLKPGEKTEFPKCYTPQGQRIDAVGVAGLSSGLVGSDAKNQFFSLVSYDAKNQLFSPAVAKFCDTAQKLLCVQQ